MQSVHIEIGSVNTQQNEYISLSQHSNPRENEFLAGACVLKFICFVVGGAATLSLSPTGLFLVRVFPCTHDVWIYYVFKNWKCCENEKKRDFCVVGEKEKFPERIISRWQLGRLTIHLHRISGPFRCLIFFLRHPKSEKTNAHFRERFHTDTPSVNWMKVIYFIRLFLPLLVFNYFRFCYWCCFARRQKKAIIFAQCRTHENDNQNFIRTIVRWKWKVIERWLLNLLLETFFLGLEAGRTAFMPIPKCSSASCGIYRMECQNVCVCEVSTCHHRKTFDIMETL